MFKQRVKSILPLPVLRLVRSYKNKEYWNLSTEQIFTKIYQSGVWGKSEDPNNQFYSGSGSRRAEEISTYLRACGEFIALLDKKPDAVDIGCGDFHVGSQIRPLCNRYTACDVVPPLIEFNRSRYSDLDVEFRVLNLVDDELPPGEVAFVRQVLQHLSNDQILKFVRRAQATYKYLVLTEHLPATADFKPNEDKPAGPGTRMGYQSGVVLTAPPFNLAPRSERQLCRVDSIDTGILVTTLYTL